MLGSYVFGCIVWILWGLVGCSLGNSKGNAQTGLWLSLLAGPLGWIAVLLLPDSREKKNSVNEAAPNADDSREMQIKLLKEILEELRISKAAHLIHIAKGKTDLGNVPIIEVRRALEEGKLGREDYYLDESAQEWKPLGEHPLL